LLHRNYKFVTGQNKCSKIPPSSLMNFCNSCVKIACCSSELVFTFLYASSIIENAIEQFASFICLSSLNFEQISEGNHSELDTCSYELLFSQCHLSPRIILTYLPGSPCIRASEEPLAAQTRLFTRHIYTARRGEIDFCTACLRCVRLAQILTTD